MASVEISEVLASTIQNNVKFAGGATLQKELQGFAAFVAYELVFQAGTNKKASLTTSLHDYYFGKPNDPTSVGLVSQLIAGTDIFSGLFEKVPSTFSESSTTELVMLPHLHCLGSDTRITVGGKHGINLSLMTSTTLKNPTHIAKRTLDSRAKEHLQNCKKALAFVKSQQSPYKQSVGCGLLPSGQTLSNYYLYVRQKMFADENPKKMVCTGDGTKDQEVLENMMPQNWTFSGFITFALLGPIVPDEMLQYRSKLMRTTLPKSTKKDGREAVRLEKQQRSGDPEVCQITPNGTADDSTNPKKKSRADSSALAFTNAAAEQTKEMRLFREQTSTMQKNQLEFDQIRAELGDLRYAIDEHRFLISCTDKSDDAYAAMMLHQKQLLIEYRDFSAVVAAKQKQFVQGLPSTNTQTNESTSNQDNIVVQLFPPSLDENDKENEE
jgi:hypothetical protein